MPFFTAPRANETWVEVGPGKQAPNAKSSMNTLSLIHFSFWIKVYTLFCSSLCVA